jgi:hypothetical protein
LGGLLRPGNWRKGRTLPEGRLITLFINLLTRRLIGCALTGTNYGVIFLSLWMINTKIIPPTVYLVQADITADPRNSNSYLHLHRLHKWWDLLVFPRGTIIRRRRPRRNGKKLHSWIITSALLLMNKQKWRRIGANYCERERKQDLVLHRIGIMKFFSLLGPLHESRLQLKS